MDKLLEVKTILRSLLVSAPLKVTVFTLNKDYNNLEGHYIPFKELGFNSLLHFLHSIPDVLRVNGTSIHSEVTLVVSEKIAHVNDLVMKQKIQSKRKKGFIPRKSVVNNPTTSFRTSNYQRRNLESQCNYNIHKEKSAQNEFAIAKTLSPFPKPVHLSPVRTSHHFNLNSSSIEENTDTESDPNLEVEVKKVSNIQSKTKKLMLIKERVNKSKVSKVQNCSNDINTNNITVAFCNDESNSKIRRVNIEENYEYERIPQEIQVNLQNLISKYPSGLLCSQLPSEYKKLYKEDLHFEKYGFGNLIRLCMTLENIFKWEKESSCDYTLYDRKLQISKIRICSDDNVHETYKSAYTKTSTYEIDPLAIVPLESNDWCENLEFVPEDALKLGKNIIHCCVNDFIIGHRVPIVVSAIYNPSKFWVYKDDGVLNTMMNSMQNYYRENKAKYLIPEFLLEVGLYCVVHTLGEFQRGLIVDLLSNIGGYVKVYFIDYGTLENISREKIWFLNTNFSHLPAQAVQGKLSNIQPVKEVWSNQSTLRFRDFVRGSHVFAKISVIEDEKLTVYIADSKSPFRFINDVLVEEGYATYVDKPIVFKTDPVPERKSDISKLLDRIRMKKMMNLSLEDRVS